MWRLVLGVLLGVLALLVCRTAMNCPAAAITEAHVVRFLFVAASALIGLLARSL
jgi:hypothetical protein